MIQQLLSRVFYNKEIYVGDEFISQIKDHKAFEGKDDTSLSRLDQYKVLEKKLLNLNLFRQFGIFGIF